MIDVTQAQEEYRAAAATYSRVWEERGDVPKAVLMVAQAVHNEVAELRELVASLDAEVGRLTDELRTLQGARR